MTESLTSPKPSPTTDDILERLSSYIGGVEDLPNLKMLIYSDPGAGKSTFLGTAPNNIIVDVEKGLTSLRNVPELVDMSKIGTFRYKNFVQLENFIQKLHEGNWSEFDTISIDSVSELHKRGLAEITEREWAKNPALMNRFTPETEHHTENNEHIRRLVSALRDLDRNVILTAHARTVQAKDGSIKVYPDFSEKLANTLAAIVDVVGFMQVKEVDGKEVRAMRVRTNGRITSKCRLGSLPDVVPEPVWDTFWKAHVKQIESAKS